MAKLAETATGARVKCAWCRPCAGLARRHAHRSGGPATGGESGGARRGAGACQAELCDTRTRKGTEDYYADNRLQGPLSQVFLAAAKGHQVVILQKDSFL